MLSPPTFALLMAYVVDTLAGELPTRLHPVAWVGAAIARLKERAPRGDRIRELSFGIALALLLPSACAYVTALALDLLGGFEALRFALVVLLLNASFASKALIDAGN